MPQNKPMKIQWIYHGGRSIPLVLPQTYSYKDDDWKITSDQDPLPIVEYGTTAGGIIVPKRVSDEGHELTQLTGSVANVELIYEEKDITVNTGTIKQVGSIFNVSQYNYVFVHLEMSIIGRCKVYERPSRGTFGGSALTQRVLVDRSNTPENAYSDYFPVISLYTRFFIENTMQNDFTYGGLYIFGVRA